MVGHSIIQALKSGIHFKNIIVSSDDDAILEKARQFDVVGHRRSSELCTDESSTESVMIDAVEHYPCNSVMVLQPTSPIRFRGRITDCIMKYKSGDYDSLVTTTKFYNLFWQEKNNPPCGYGWVCTSGCLERPIADT